MIGKHLVTEMKENGKHLLQLCFSYGLRIKDSADNILTDENKVLSRCREYFEALLNPVKALTRDTQGVRLSGEDEVFTAAEVATAIKGIKSA